MSEIRVNTIVAAEGTSAPNLPYGIQVPTGMGITGAGGVNITGVVTAVNIDGTLIAGSAINSSGLSTVGILTVTKDIYVGAAATIDGALTGTTGTFSGAVSGTTGTFSGAVNVDATTDSTSVTTGALIVDGGVGIAKNVYIGAGLSVAGTLTYEDVTNVDSVGLITAKSGVNISGGELKVGSALTVSGVGVATFIGAAGVGVTITPSTGKVQATTIEGPLTGDVTGDLTGTVNTAAQTSITSLGTLTGLTVSGDLFLDNGSTAGRDILWDVSDNALKVSDNTNINIGTGNDLKLYHDSSNSYVNSQGTGDLLIRGDDVKIQDAANGHNMAVFTEDGSVDLYYDNSAKFATTNEGIQVTGFTSTTAGLGVTGGMWEGAFIKAGKLTDNKTLGISTSNIFVFTTQETTTGTPNIIWNDTYALSSKMKVGDAVTITVITTAAAAGYCANWTIDGNAVTEQWNGGSAPSAGGSDGYDIYTHTLVRKATGTGDSGWLMFSNVSNFT